MTLEKVKYPSINGLRAMSILLVILYHLNMNDHVLAWLEKFSRLRPLTLFLQDGGFGVNVFFVISGFLISSLMLQEEKQTKNVSLKNFYVRRTLRIFPAYYFLLLVYFILQFIGYIHISGPSWFTALTYTKYFNWKTDWFTAHAWSLSIEEHFYIFWPLIFVYASDFRKLFTWALIILVPIIRTCLYFHPITWMNELNIFTRIDSIATGCLFALYKDEIIEKLSPYWRPLFYISAFVLFFLNYFPYYADYFHLSFVFIPLGLTHGTIANLFIAIIMMYSIFGPQKLWYKFLNLKAINYIGLLSYSIYLWQQVFLSKSDHWIVQFPQNVFFILAMAMFSYYLIENPFLKLKDKFQHLK